MKRGLGVFLCLALGVPLAAAAVASAWIATLEGTSVYRSRDWVLVKADVVAGAWGATPGEKRTGHLAYTFEGRRYEGRRLSMGSVWDDNIDAWRQSQADELAQRKAQGRSLSVWVDPDDPARSVLYRTPQWDHVILFGLLAAMSGLPAFSALRSAVRVATGAVPDASTAAKGAGFLWVFALIWNAFAFFMAFLMLGDILEGGEWGGLFVLLFPLVGILVFWGAVSGTLGRIQAAVAREPGGRPSPGPVTVKRGLIDTPPRRAAAGPLDIPPSVAEVKEEGGLLTVRFLPRRRLPVAVAVLVAGALLSVAGVVMLFGGDSRVGAGVLLVIATAFDLGGVSLLTQRLTIYVRAGVIGVEKGNLFGSRNWTLRREAIEWIGPVLSYKANGVPVYAIHAKTRKETVSLGDSLRGASLAERYADRLAATAGFPESLVRAASSPAGDGA